MSAAIDTPTAPAARRVSVSGRAFRSLRAAAPLLLPLVVSAQSYPVYTVTSLPAVSSVTAFNDSGLILGRGFVPCSGLCTQSDVPILFDTRTGTVKSLGSGFGVGVQFDAINAAGQLAGSTTTVDASGATLRSVVIRQVDGTLTPLTTPTLSASQTGGLRARGLNASGQIALQHTDGLDAVGPVCGNYQAWSGTGKGATPWQSLGAAGTVVRASGINAGGVTVGSAVPATSCAGAGGGFRAVAALASGALVDLHGTMPGSFSRANAINDLGYAVGDYDSGLRTAASVTYPQGMPITRASVWNTASQAWFDVGPAASLSRLNAVNRRGEVVGSAGGPVLAGQPYVPSAPRGMLGNLATTWPMVDLNALLANNTDGWVLHDAVAINAGGQIIAHGASAAGSGYVLLVPVSAPFDPYATAPSAPASLATSQLTASSVVLTWTNTARNATQIVVERCRGSNCTNFAAIKTLPGDTVRFGDAGLARRTAYRWRVRAGNASGASAPSNIVSATTLR